MIAYFGCWDRPGHFLRIAGNQHPSRSDEAMFPSAAHLDGSILFLPRPEKVGTGMLTYLPAPNLTVLAWWGSPFDKRGAVNSAVIVSGHVKSSDSVWGAFEKAFPQLVSKLSQPQIVER